MILYNTLTKKLEEFKPIKKGVVKLYHCGPTVYWTQHIGNLRGMFCADLTVRTLRYLGYKVKHVRNYTDVGHLTSDEDAGEDKMEKGARREGLKPEEIAKKYIGIFEQDTRELNMLEPTVKPRATEHIEEMIDMTQILINKGYAYSTDLAVYFDVSKAKNYTKLSGQVLEKNIQGAGKSEISDPQKKHYRDFVLWFFQAGTHKNALQHWPSPFKSSLVKNGQGFPGWHIECSVMSKKHLGNTLDIHMGGIEHIPVHHTNEIAQSESANGAKFANYWLHNEHLLVDNKKMAKSEGTSHSLIEIKNKGFNPLSLRYLFLTAHYRSKLNFTWKSLEASQNALNKLYDFMSLNGDRIFIMETESPFKPSSLYKEKFQQALENNLDTPKALAVVWEMIKSKEISYDDKKKAMLKFDKVLGLGLDKIKKKKTEISDEVKELIKQREEARENKDWEKADKLREEIKERGLAVEDKPVK
ncbi:cysteine--tRNA ligase [Patescibacteria group bacterium]|nr:cysteine--tRNA ligase [Patescibacteria group bacterium]